MIRGLRRALRPRIQIDAVTDLRPAILHSLGITALIVDLDGTLAPRGDLPGVDVVAWLVQMEAAGIRVCLVSNNLPGRVMPVAGYLGIPGVSVAMKPLKYGFQRALRVLGSLSANTAVAGDRLITDVLGGNRMGLTTVLVRGKRPGRRGKMRRIGDLRSDRRVVVKEPLAGAGLGLR